MSVRDPWLLVGAAALLVASSCEASLAGKKPPCIGGYKACKSICVPSSDACVGLGSWPTLPVTREMLTSVPRADMSKMTVFAVSQVRSDGEVDGQLSDLRPDLVLRAWGQWHKDGTSDTDYVAKVFEGLQNPSDQRPRVRFMGGGTATAVFSDQFKDSADDPKVGEIGTRDGSGNLVFHDDLNSGERRGSLANANFREYLLKIAKYQIDDCIDGLHYTEVDADYLGKRDSVGKWSYDEGFDDAHLADFNRFLLTRYPDVDFASRFQMKQDNLLRRDVPPERIGGNDPQARNFDYRVYRAGVSKEDDLLLPDWGRDVVPGNPRFGGDTFIDTATTYRYWGALVQELRRMAASPRNCPNAGPFLITANGIFPYVDFVSYSFYDETDMTSEFFPFDDQHLDGSLVAQDRFRDIRRRADLMVPGAPVVLYMDGRWETYHTSLSEVERRDFWRIYAAEAYANGLFFAFLVKPPPVSPKAGHGGPDLPMARQEGTLSLFLDLAAFYRGHADYYHDVVPSEDPSAVAIEPAGSQLSWAVSDAAPSKSPRRLVHLINHDYTVPSSATATTGLNTQLAVKLSVASLRVPASATVVSPDAVRAGLPLPPPAPLDFTYADGRVSLTLPALEAYAVVALNYE